MATLHSIEKKNHGPITKERPLVWDILEKQKTKVVRAFKLKLDKIIMVVRVS